MKLILKGIGACRGFARGNARVVKDLTDIPEIENRCILVIPFFTPTLTMLVSKAGGIVADFGGITSHAAVIAREFNVPCIVGVNEASSRIKDGQIICMDGEKGEIYGI